MFSGFSPFLNFPIHHTDTPNDTQSFAGIPLVNPLLNDAQTNINTLDDRITQLESVSQWLNMNLQMVNGSIQQLQVQKQTLLALAEWQKLSQTAMDELVKINPFSSPSETEELQQTNDSNTAKSSTQTKAHKSTRQSKNNKTKIDPNETHDVADTEASVMPEAFEKMAQSWWDGLQQQFTQLAQPLMQDDDTPSKMPKATSSKTPQVKRRVSKKSPATPQKPSTTV